VSREFLSQYDRNLKYLIFVPIISSILWGGFVEQKEDFMMAHFYDLIGNRYSAKVQVIDHIVNDHYTEKQPVLVIRGENVVIGLSSTTISADLIPLLQKFIKTGEV
jgi:hypothetical protein